MNTEAEKLFDAALDELAANPAEQRDRAALMREAAILAISRHLPIKCNIFDQQEYEIALRLIDAGLAEGLVISVWEGEDHAIQNSTDRATLMGALASTDSDWVNFHDTGGDRVAAVLLIYGNGEDLISDYTVTDMSEKLTKIANQEDA